MRISFNASLRATPPRLVLSRKTALLCGAILLLGDLCLLVCNFGFATYAMGGFLTWSHANGTVISATNSSAPMVEFVTDDGSVHQFSEDYILLCGARYSLCYIRDFTVGQRVPIVYAPRNPGRAYIHDFALIENSITWFFEAFLGLLFLWMMTFRATGKGGSFSLHIGQAAQQD
jgi:hypothetical protein